MSQEPFNPLSPAGFASPIPEPMDIFDFLRSSGGLVPTYQGGTMSGGGAFDNVAYDRDPIMSPKQRMDLALAQQAALAVAPGMVGMGLGATRAPVAALGSAQDLQPITAELAAMRALRQRPPISQPMAAQLGWERPLDPFGATARFGPGVPRPMPAMSNPVPAMPGSAVPPGSLPPSEILPANLMTPSALGDALGAPAGLPLYSPSPGSLASAGIEAGPLLRAPPRMGAQPFPGPPEATQFSGTMPGRMGPGVPLGQVPPRVAGPARTIFEPAEATQFSRLPPAGAMDDMMASINRQAAGMTPRGPAQPSALEALLRQPTFSPREAALAAGAFGTTTLGVAGGVQSLLSPDAAPPQSKVQPPMVSTPSEAMMSIPDAGVVTGPDGPAKYTVQRGNWLSTIAQSMLGGGASPAQVQEMVQRIAAMNQIQNPHQIQTGQQLSLPMPVQRDPNTFRPPPPAASTLGMRPRSEVPGLSGLPPPGLMPQRRTFPEMM